MKNIPDVRPNPSAGAKIETFQISRRSFLRRCTTVAAAAGLPFWFVQRELAAASVVPKRLSPNDRPGVALVGCGGMGKNDARAASGFGDVVAVCDVDEKQAAEAVERLSSDGKAPAVCADFRNLMEREDIHVVINATPDHWHTLVNLAAANARKDVYAEKPLTLTIAEGRRLADAVRESGIILQTGTQQRSSQRFRLACELVRNGRLGELQQASVWLPAGLREGPFSPAPVPAGLNWDFWLGQAPKVEYVPQRCHRTFRFWYEYSGGTMTDWGAHHNDIAFWATGLIAPREIESRVLAEPIPGGYNAHSEYEVTYTFANGLRLNVYTTRDDSIFGQKLKPDGQRNGIRFEGSQGWLWVNRDRMVASDPELIKAPLPETAERLYNSSNHMENFFDCVRSRKAPICDVETGHRSATICHLGAIALRTGRKLTWDAVQERFAGDHADLANRYVAREMRTPYDYGFIA